MSLSQRKASTPSPVSKGDGSNKRVLVNKGNPSSKPQQPPQIMEPTINTPNVAMEIILTTSGQDGNESINSNPNPNPYRIQPTYYRWYIDDIFFIWNNSVMELEQFINHLNSIHPTIKFTNSTSSTMITYLDLDIYIKEHQFNTKIHFKSTNTFSYLHGKSNHPASTFKGVYKGENIHILRNTTDEDTYNSTMTFINQQFKRRQYPSRLTSVQPIQFTERDKYLESSKDTTGATTFVTTYDPSINMRENLITDWPRLSSNQELRERFAEPPRITYKHSPNIAQSLVRAKCNYQIATEVPTFSPTPIQFKSYPVKNIPCRNDQNGTCPQLTSRSHYSSYQTKPEPYTF